MILIFLLGAATGAVASTAHWLALERARGAPREPPDVISSDGDSELDHPVNDTLSDILSVLAIGIATAGTAIVGGVVTRRTWRGRKTTRDALDSDRDGLDQQQRKEKTGRIPLKDVIRFKERQWFLEELQGCRDGDPNAMLRLAKMYLHGQGCEPSALKAQEWLKRARQLGVMGTLEELYAGDGPNKRQQLRHMLLLEERKRAKRSGRAAQAPRAGTAASTKL